MNGPVIVLVRTIVQSVAGALTAILIAKGVDTSSEVVFAALMAVGTAGYAVLMRWAQTRWPGFAVKALGPPPSYHPVDPATYEPVDPPIYHPLPEA